MSNSTLSPEVALHKPRCIQQHHISINVIAPITGRSIINQEQAAVLEALHLEKSTMQDVQMTLL